LLSSRMT